MHRRCIRQGDDAQDAAIIRHDRGRHGFHRQSRHLDPTADWIRAVKTNAATGPPAEGHQPPLTGPSTRRRPATSHTTADLDGRQIHGRRHQPSPSRAAHRSPHPAGHGGEVHRRTAQGRRPDRRSARDRIWPRHRGQQSNLERAPPLRGRQSHRRQDVVADRSCTPPCRRAPARQIWHAPNLPHEGTKKTAKGDLS